MKINEVIEYQKDIADFLKSAYIKDKLTHAYIFEGDHGTGTYEMSLYFAMMLLCKDDNGPCLSCNTCERILYNSHMNVITIEPINNMIKKEQIEGLMDDFHHTTLEGGANIYIIKDASLMNTAAENALLKLLEEPNPKHYIILTTTNHMSLLPTTNSRCQLLKFKVVSSNVIESYLQEKGSEDDLAYTISKFTLDLEEAVSYFEADKFKELLNITKKIYIQKFKKDEAFIEYFLNKKFMLELEKKDLIIFLEMMILVLEELLKGDSKHYKDIYTLYEKSNYNQADIINFINVIHNYEIKCNSYVNTDLLFTALFSEI